MPHTVAIANEPRKQFNPAQSRTTPVMVKANGCMSEDTYLLCTATPLSNQATTLPSCTHPLPRNCRRILQTGQQQLLRERVVPPNDDGVVYEFSDEVGGGTDGHARHQHQARGSHRCGDSLPRVLDMCHAAEWNPLGCIAILSNWNSLRAYWKPSRKYRKIIGTYCKPIRMLD